jgi:hypothetical protein
VSDIEREPVKSAEGHWLLEAAQQRSLLSKTGYFTIFLL